MIIPLSHPLTAKTPLYPNTPAPVIKSLRSIGGGDHANTSTISFSTHSGTHIDAPSHFCEQGISIMDFFSVTTSFFPAYYIDICRPGSYEIGVGDLEGCIFQARNAEALLLRTGWDSVRSEDPERYCTDHPWVSPDLAQFLRINCPGLRIFGLDQISVSSSVHRETGYHCHQNFLCGQNPILLLEDLNLSDRQLKNPFRIHIFPYFIDKIDGVPVTVIAEIPV